MEPLFPPLSLATYPTSRASTTIIKVSAGGGRSNRGPNTALWTHERETENVEIKDSQTTKWQDLRANENDERE